MSPLESPQWRYTEETRAPHPVKTTIYQEEGALGVIIFACKTIAACILFILNNRQDSTVFPRWQIEHRELCKVESFELNPDQRALSDKLARLILGRLDPYATITEKNIEHLQQMTAYTFQEGEKYRSNSNYTILRNWVDGRWTTSELRVFTGEKQDHPVYQKKVHNNRERQLPLFYNEGPALNQVVHLLDEMDKESRPSAAELQSVLGRIAKHLDGRSAVLSRTFYSNQPDLTMRIHGHADTVEQWKEFLSQPHHQVQGMKITPKKYKDTMTLHFQPD